MKHTERLRRTLRLVKSCLEENEDHEECVSDLGMALKILQRMERREAVE